MEHCKFGLESWCLEQGIKCEECATQPSPDDHEQDGHFDGELGYA